MIKLNKVIINPTIFPDKTSQVWKLPENVLESSKYDIIFDFENEGEIFQLIQLRTLLQQQSPDKPVSLYMPYLPYSRQDKNISNSETFALHSFARILNSMNFNLVSTLDSHNSIICYKIINEFTNIYPETEIMFAVKSTNPSIVAFPDSGARNRYHNPLMNPVIIGHKVREQSTGYITSYNIEGHPKNKDILIIDDICDGGMTFKLLTEQLLNEGANKVHLYVTHGIFSKGVDTLRTSGINRIFDKTGEIYKR